MNNLKWSHIRTDFVNQKEFNLPEINLDHLTSILYKKNNLPNVETQSKTSSEVFTLSSDSVKTILGSDPCSSSKENLVDALTTYSTLSLKRLHPKIPGRYEFPNGFFKPPGIKDISNAIDNISPPTSHDSSCNPTSSLLVSRASHSHVSTVRSTAPISAA